jgi:hypothetical protein
MRFVVDVCAEFVHIMWITQHYRIFKCLYYENDMCIVCLLLARQPPVGQGPLFHEVPRSHKRRTTDGRNPLDEWSLRRRDLYLTTHNSHNRQTSKPLVGFEPTTPAGKRPQTYSMLYNSQCVVQQETVSNTRQDKFAQTSVSWQMSQRNMFKA